MDKRAALKLLGAGPLLATLGSGARAQARYPERPVTLIVPFPPGGGTDGTMRAFAAAFTDITRQPVTVENRPGGGTLISLAQLRAKEPDGYTLGTMTMAAYTAYWISRGKASVHPVDDIELISGTHGSIFALLARGDSPFNTLDDLVKAAKANPSKPFTIGNIGNGTTHHVVGWTFEQQAGIKVEHVPFKGEVDAVVSMIGGHTDFAVSSGSFVPQVEAGKAKVLGLAMPARLERYPQWRTCREQGYDIVAGTQVGICAPKGVPAALSDRIDAIVREVSRHPEFVAASQRLYQPIQYLDRNEYRKMAADAFTTQRALVEKMNLGNG